MIQIVFQLTRKELFAGVMAIVKSRLGTKVSQIVGLLFVLGSVVIIISEIVYMQRTSLYAWLFLVFSLFITFYLRILIWFQIKTLVKRKAQITESVTYTFTKTDYTLTGKSFSTRMDYDKLYEVRVIPDFILLKVSEVSAHVIPKRALSDDQFDALKEIIQSIPELKSKFHS
ncbi:hypothetical protein GCM10027299_27030 [Larkinella ripae]